MIMQFGSIWPIDRTLSGATTPGQNGHGTMAMKEVLHITQRFSITGISLSDCLVSYSGHSFGKGFYPSAEVQSVYSTAPADWATYGWEKVIPGRYKNRSTWIRERIKVSNILKIIKEQK